MRYARELNIAQEKLHDSTYRKWEHTTLIHNYTDTIIDRGADRWRLCW